MNQRGSPLRAGQPPLLTAGYHLAARHVLHVTGPCIQPPHRDPTAAEQATLSSCYTGCLERAANAGIRTIAFCCLSTGLFGFPSGAAAMVAMSCVKAWLQADETRGACFDVIIFNVFSATDEQCYCGLAPSLFEVRASP